MHQASLLPNEKLLITLPGFVGNDRDSAGCQAATEAVSGSTRSTIRSLARSNSPRRSLSRSRSRSRSTLSKNKLHEIPKECEIDIELETAIPESLFEQHVKLKN